MEQEEKAKWWQFWKWPNPGFKYPPSKPYKPTNFTREVFDPARPYTIKVIDKPKSLRIWCSTHEAIHPVIEFYVSRICYADPKGEFINAFIIGFPPIVTEVCFPLSPDIVLVEVTQHWHAFNELYQRTMIGWIGRFERDEEFRRTWGALSGLNKNTTTDNKESKVQ